MPELPEVETMARELAPLIVGATISQSWTDWPAAVRHPDVAGYLAALPGRRIVGVRRRAKWLVIELDQGALVIQVKMTGQLTVVRGHDAPRPVRARHLDVHRRPGAALARRAQVRAHRRVRRRGAQDDPRPAWPGAARLGLHRGRLPAATARPARRGSSRSLVDQAFLAGVGNIYADEALWRATSPPVAPCHEPAPQRRAPSLPGTPRHPPGGHRSTGQLDQRLHGTRGRRRDAGAPRRLSADRATLPSLRAPDPAHRARCPRHALLLLVSTAASPGTRRVRGAPAASRHLIRCPSCDWRPSAARSAPSSSSMMSAGPSRRATASAWSGSTVPARRRSCAWPPGATSPMRARSCRVAG